MKKLFAKAFPMYYPKHQPKIAFGIMVMAFTLTGLVLQVTTVAQILPLIVVSLAIVSVVQRSFCTIEENLNRRIAAEDGGPKWTVSVNGIKVGEISDASYASISKGVYADWRAYVAQAMNCLKVLNRMANYLCIALPLEIFWLSLGAFLFAKAQFFEFLHAFSQLSPDQIYAPAVVMGIFTVSILTVMGHMFFGHNFGFENVFSAGIGWKVRSRVGCPTEGRVTLWRMKDGDIVFNDELKYLRKA